MKIVVGVVWINGKEVVPCVSLAGRGGHHSVLRRRKKDGGMVPDSVCFYGTRSHGSFDGCRERIFFSNGRKQGERSARPSLPFANPHRCGVSRIFIAVAKGFAWRYEYSNLNNVSDHWEYEVPRKNRARGIPVEWDQTTFRNCTSEGTENQITLSLLPCWKLCSSTTS